MIITLDAGSPQGAGAIIMSAWKHGVEVERLTGNQLELWCGNDTKVENLIKRFPYAKILHRELVKEINIYDNPI